MIAAGEAVCGTALTSGGYTYQLTPQDLAREQKAFEPGPGVSTHTLYYYYYYYYFTKVFFNLLQKCELVENMGVYISFVDLETHANSSKQTATGLMRTLLSVWY